MYIATVLEPAKETFEEYVRAHPRGTFLQSWAWGDWRASQHKKTFRLLFMKEQDVIGAAQVIVMKTPMGNYAYAPYGPLWNMDLNDREIVELLASFVAYFTKMPGFFFARIEPTIVFDLKKIGAKPAETVQPPQTLIKDITAPPEELLAGFHHKTRYNVKVAQKHEVTITTYDKPNKQVIDLIMQTSDRQGYRNHPRSYIEQLWQFFSNNPSDITAVGYLAQYNDIPVASGLMIDHGNTRMYLFGGSDYEHRSVMAPYLMHWQAMLDAKQKGLTQYDFGASENASGHTGGYMRFKMGFSPVAISFAGTYDFPIRTAWYTIYTFIRKLNRIRLHLTKRN